MEGDIGARFAAEAACRREKGVPLDRATRQGGIAGMRSPWRGVCFMQAIGHCPAVEPAFRLASCLPVREGGWIP
jgi:hypothetical protein